MHRPETETIHYSETGSGRNRESESGVCTRTDPLFGSGKDKSIEREYAGALLREIGQAPFKFGFDSSEYRVKTIYFGGGTPSCIDEVYIISILRKLYECFDIKKPEETEITLEANPGTLTESKLIAFRKAGINRLSLGLQSASDKELKLLGRIHSYDDFLKSYELSRRAGFENINVDIMTAIPGQDMESLNDTLCKLVKLDPEHISAYSLILEEGTPFYSMYHRDEEGSDDREAGSGHIKPPRPVRQENSSLHACDLSCHAELPSAEAERQMYWFVRDELKKHGYDRYEISNFAKKGFESRHNRACWKRIPYLGFGLGASSLINETRYRNTTDMQRYLNGPDDPSLFEEKIKISEKERMEETMFLGLRTAEGVSIPRFFDTFGVRVYDIYKDELTKLKRDGLITISEEAICLTDKGTDYGNYVFSRFLF